MRTAGGWLATLDPVTVPERYVIGEPPPGDWAVEHADDDPQRLRELPRDVAAQRVAYAAVCHRLLVALRAADR